MVNKKGDFLALSILLLLVLIGGIYIIEGNYQNKRYIGDSLNKVYYYIDSQNTNCKIDKISIDTNNLKFFESPKEAEKQGYVKDKNCN